MGRVGEAELVLPCLMLLYMRPSTTSELIEFLMNTLVIDDEDLEILEGRTDTKFSQKVRNLRAHRKFEKLGVATYSDGTFHITDNGRKYVEDHNANMEEVMTRVVTSKKEEVLSEGQVVERTTKSKKRSSRMKAIARQYYSRQGDMICANVNCPTDGMYGEYNKYLIELHHVQGLTEIEMTFGELWNDMESYFIPLCSNCHAVIDKLPNKSLKELKELTYGQKK